MIAQSPNSPPEIEGPLELTTIARGAVQGRVMQNELLRELHDMGVRPKLVINEVIYWPVESVSEAASTIYRRKLEQRDNKKP